MASTLFCSSWSEVVAKNILSWGLSSLSCIIILKRNLFDQILNTDDILLQGLVECEYQFRNDRWNCTDNRDTARIQTTLERGICQFVMYISFCSWVFICIWNCKDYGETAMIQTTLEKGICKLLLYLNHAEEMCLYLSCISKLHEQWVNNRPQSRLNSKVNFHVLDFNVGKHLFEF